MKGIIIAYPIRNTALQLKSLFQEEGLYVSHICSTGASVLSLAAELQGGIVVCSSVLADMTSTAIAESLPQDFDIVAITKNGRQSFSSNYTALPMPIDKNELISIVSTLAMSSSSFTNREKEDAESISQAKEILMRINKMTEMQAHKFLQKESMRLGMRIADVAKKIIN